MIDCRKCWTHHKRTEPCRLPSIAAPLAKPRGAPGARIKPLETLMTVKEVCAILRISKAEFYYLKEIPRFKVGGRWKIRPSELQRYLSEKEGS